jgi:hypothetical protein
VLQGEEPLASAASMSTKLPPYTHQWVHDEVIIKDGDQFPGEYAKLEDLSSVTNVNINLLKEAVVTVINDNIGTIKTLTPDNQIHILMIKNGDIVQDDNIILSSGVFDLLTTSDDITTVNANLKYDTCTGPECPNVIAYIQYYVALACKCVSIGTPKLAQGGNECHKTLLENALKDFDLKNQVFITEMTDSYSSKIRGTEYTVSINVGKDGIMKLIDNDHKAVLTVKLSNYFPAKIRIICLICIYYFTTYTMMIVKNINPTLSQPNLLAMIKCWIKSNAIQLAPMTPAPMTPGWNPSPLNGSPSP